MMTTIAMRGLSLMACLSALALTLVACGDSSGSAADGGAAGATAGAGGVGGAGAAGADAGGAGQGGASGAGAGAAGAGGSLAVDSGLGDDDGGSTVAAASATLTAVDGSGSTITGTATFAHNGTSVTVIIQLSNCPNGAYPVHIHEGFACSAYGAHWDTTRGEGINDITCSGNGGTITYTRNFFGGSPTDWTIGDGTATDVIGHTVVVHAAGGGSPILCGAITMP